MKGLPTIAMPQKIQGTASWNGEREPTWAAGEGHVRHFLVLYLLVIFLIFKLGLGFIDIEGGEKERTQVAQKAYLQEDLVRFLQRMECSS
jgi:hypothetical protein